jgi:RND family efflux transporter MFP subunit
MKTIIISIITLAVGFGLAYLVLVPENNSNAEKTTMTGQQYTCGMHPQIISNEPGYCPICGMKLTLKKSGTSSIGKISVDPTTTQNMGIVTSTAAMQRMVKKVRAFGNVAYSEPNIFEINLKIDGWVEKLFVDKTGEQVRKGQPLLEIYSPELVATQREYLVAYKQLRDNPTEGMKNLLKATHDRLINWDISESQIDRLIENAEVKRTMTIDSPADGFVIEKDVVQGERLEPGRQLYQIADLSAVWINAFVYEQDLPFVSLRQTADISFPSLPGTEYSAKVSYISPFLDSKHQVEIRLEMENPGNKLRPEMYAEITLNAQLENERLAIPRSAVINSGTKQIVYLAEGDGSYSPAVIMTGVIGDNDLIEVISGLRPGNAVVTSGQFMLDSESRLNEAIEKGDLSRHNHGQQPKMDHNAEKMSHDSVLQPSEAPEKGDGSEPNHGQQSDMADMNNMNNNDEKTATVDEMIATGGHDIYTCPMPEHYHVLQYGEGTCPECGMLLVPLAETDNKNAYVCPMTECGTVKDSPGTCPVCGMNLVKYQPEGKDD